MELAKLFKRDVSGGTRVWWSEVGEGKLEGYWRTHSGSLYGAITSSEWKYAEPASQPSSASQALFYANAAMEKRLKTDYKEDIDDIDESRNSMIRPMLARKYVGWQRACYVQPKLDGIRCLANIDGLWSRDDRRIISTPHIERELKLFFQLYPNVVLDGELYNHRLHDNFNKIVSLAHKSKPDFAELQQSEELIQYWIFDMCDLDERNAKFEERWDWLQEKLFDVYLSDKIIRVQTRFVSSKEELDVYNLKLLEHGYEGQILRHNVRYEEKRSNNLLKRKEFVDEEFELLDILEGDGSWQGFAKIAVCSLQDGRQFRAGISGDQDYCFQLLVEKDKYHSVTVKYQALTPDGIPRFPIATKFYEELFGGMEERIKPRRNLFA
jgi:DNA ligase-1